MVALVCLHIEGMLVVMQERYTRAWCRYTLRVVGLRTGINSRRDYVGYTDRTHQA